MGGIGPSYKLKGPALDYSESEQLENYRLAIGVMTAWIDKGDSTQFVVDYVNNLLETEGPAVMTDLVSGLVMVSGRLLVRLGKATGRTERAIIQELAQL